MSVPDVVTGELSTEKMDGMDSPTEVTEPAPTADGSHLLVAVFQLNTCPFVGVAADTDLPCIFATMGFG